MLGCFCLTPFITCSAYGLPNSSNWVGLRWWAQDSNNWTTCKSHSDSDCVSDSASQLTIAHLNGKLLARCLIHEHLPWLSRLCCEIEIRYFHGAWIQCGRFLEEIGSKRLSIQMLRCVEQTAVLKPQIYNLIFKSISWRRRVSSGLSDICLKKTVSAHLWKLPLHWHCDTWPRCQSLLYANRETGNMLRLL